MISFIWSFTQSQHENSFAIPITKDKLLSTFHMFDVETEACTSHAEQL